jgi:hypothetical protein
MVSVRLATGIAKRSKKIEVDLRVAFVDFDSTEPFTVIEMDDRFDLILGMPWLERHEPWINWRTKSIGSSSPGRSEVQARHEPSFAHRQVNSISSDGTSLYFVGVVDTTESSGMLPSLQASRKLRLSRPCRVRLGSLIQAVSWSKLSSFLVTQLG